LAADVTSSMEVETLRAVLLEALPGMLSPQIEALSPRASLVEALGLTSLTAIRIWTRVRSQGLASLFEVYWTQLRLLHRWLL